MTPKLQDGLSRLESIASELDKDWSQFSQSLTTTQTKYFQSWRYNSRPGQRPPSGNWRTWVMLGGRGAGKTRAGAEWVAAQVRLRNYRRIALAGPSLHIVREVMIEGESGLRNLAGPRPIYEAGRRRLVWPSGAQAQVISANDPDNFRGPQFDAVWADELCVWQNAEEVLSTLRLGLRLGRRPRLVVTTTPRPMRALSRLLAEPDTVSWRITTASNEANLAPGHTKWMAAQYGGSDYGRQELDGEFFEDSPGALWTKRLVEACVVTTWPKLERIVVAVDPPASAGPRADACGIVAVGVYGDPPRAVVVEDASMKGGTPMEWAACAVRLADLLKAQIHAEANNGGEMVRTVLRVAGAATPVHLLTARQAKQDRARPVSMLYHAGRVTHAGRFKELEDEMCSFGAAGFSGSPDRLDALVWALTVLMIENSDPHVRTY